MSPAAARRWRIALATTGLLGIGFGIRGVLTGGVATAPVETGRWLLAGVLAHDLLLLPLVAVAGWALGRVGPAAARPVLRGGLLVAGTVALVAVPVLTGRGGHGNASSNPLDYPRNLAALLAGIAVVTVALAAVRVRRARPKWTVRDARTADVPKS